MFSQSWNKTNSLSMMPKSVTVTVTVSPITASFQTNVNQTSSLWRKKKKKESTEQIIKADEFYHCNARKKISAFEWG